MRRSSRGNPYHWAAGSPDGKGGRFAPKGMGRVVEHNDEYYIERSKQRLDAQNTSLSGDNRSGDKLHVEEFISSLPPNFGSIEGLTLENTNKSVREFMKSMAVRLNINTKDIKFQSGTAKRGKYSGCTYFWVDHSRGGQYQFYRCYVRNTGNTEETAYTVFHELFHAARDGKKSMGEVDLEEVEAECAAHALSEKNGSDFSSLSYSGKIIYALPRLKRCDKNFMNCHKTSDYGMKFWEERMSSETEQTKDRQQKVENTPLDDEKYYGKYFSDDVRKKCESGFLDNVRRQRGRAAEEEAKLGIERMKEKLQNGGQIDPDMEVFSSGDYQEKMGIHYIRYAMDHIGVF